jgi:hypothetical protein
LRRLLVSLLLLALPLVAQQPRAFEPVDSGKVIRFQVGGVVARGRMLTTLHSTSDSAMYCRLPGPPCAGQVEPWQVGWVRPATLEQLEVQVGTNTAKGARIGAVVGALLTFASYSIAAGFCESQCPSNTEVIVSSGLIGGLWGAGIGALYGSGSARMERRF